MDESEFKQGCRCSQTAPSPILTFKKKKKFKQFCVFSHMKRYDENVNIIHGKQANMKETKYARLQNIIEYECL